MAKIRHPMQPLLRDDHGVIRFKKNKVIQRMIDIVNLNSIGLWADCPVEDHEQLAQLIGYSVSGFSNLSYAQKKTIRKANRRARKLSS